MSAHRSARQPELASDLEIATAFSDQVQQVSLASGELGDGAPPAFSIVVGLLEMGSQQGAQRPVALGEVKAGFAPKEEPNGPTRPGVGPRRLGEAGLYVVLNLAPWVSATSTTFLCLLRLVSGRRFGTCESTSRRT